MAKDYCAFHGRRTRTRSISFSGAVHPSALVALFVFFLSGLGYVYALNRGAVQGYRVRELEKEITELKKENKRLEISLAERQSLTRIEASAREHEMEPVTDIRVLEGRGQFALR